MLTRVWAFSPCPMARLSVTAPLDGGGDAQPTARAVDAVVIVGATREFGGDLAGEVDAGAGMEPQTRGVLQHRREAELQTERSEEHTSELQSRLHLVCRLLLEKKKKNTQRLHCDG